MLIPHNPSKNMRKPVVVSRDADITIVTHDVELPSMPAKKGRQNGRTAAMIPRVPAGS